MVTAASAFALPVPERLVYDVSWRGISAGRAVQEVTTADPDHLRIVNSINSSGVVSVFFSIDDRNESVISKGRVTPAGRPTYFREDNKEGKTQRLKEARFDHQGLKVHVKDLCSDSEKVDAISPTTYDTLSSVYFIRSSELTPGQAMFFDVYDLKHLWKTEVRVVKREEVRTPAGTFKTIMVTSQLRSADGTPARVGNSTVWLTDDKRHIPVKISTTSKVGDITLTLASATYR